MIKIKIDNDKVIITTDNELANGFIVNGNYVSFMNQIDKSSVIGGEINNLDIEESFSTEEIIPS